MADESISIVSIEERDRWEAEHRQGGLPSQSWSYSWALRASGVDPKLAVVRAGGARMLMPFVERSWRGATDIATTAGLSGASITPSSTAPLTLWREFAKSRGWVAGYIRLAVSVAFGDDLPEVGLVPNRTVFLLDLNGDDLLRSSAEIVRRKVRKAAKLGAVLVTDRPSLANRLKRLYPATMGRVGAGPEYDFREETLERWARDPSSVVLGGRLGDSVEAVSVFCVAGPCAEYHINASTPRGRELTAWLIWNAANRLMDADVDVLNLGGAGKRPGDGVYRFKERFNGTPIAVRAVRQIYDQRTYEELCREAGAASSGPWFPAYRAQQSPGGGGNRHAERLPSNG
jgi:hypothetical protein